MASVRKLPNGKWQAQYRPVPGGRQVTKNTTRKVDAERWLQEQLTSLTTGQWVDPSAGRITFAAFYADWADRQVWETGTRRAMDLAVRSTSFADVPLRLLRRSHLELWVADMRKPRGAARPDGLAAGTIRTRFNNVRAVLRAAVEEKRLGLDPSKGVRLPRRRRSEAAMRLPTVQEVRALLDSAEPERRVFIALCAFAGLRLGEAAALQAGDFDLAAGSVMIKRQVQRAGGDRVEIRVPKYGSERVVHMPRGLVLLVRAQIELAGRQRPGREWLFRGDSENPPHQNTVGYWWRRTRTAARCPDLRLHDLRHFFASGLIMAGCDVVTVQRALGHSSPTVTLNTYAHLWPKAEDRTRAAAANLMQAVDDEKC
jgi:integrase